MPASAALVSLFLALGFSGSRTMPLPNSLIGSSKGLSPTCKGSVRLPRSRRWWWVSAVCSSGAAFAVRGGIAAERGARTHLSLGKDAPDPRAIHPPRMGKTFEEAKVERGYGKPLNLKPLATHHPAQRFSQVVLVVGFADVAGVRVFRQGLNVVVFGEA